MKDAPYAFGSTWEKEKNLTEQQWRNLVQSRTRFVAEHDGRVVGMAAGGESGYSRVASLTSLWVDPRARGMGVGDALMLTVIEWATDMGNGELVLWVVDGNTHAEKLYRRHSFYPTGESQPVRPGEDRVEFEMTRRLG